MSGPWGDGDEPKKPADPPPGGKPEDGRGDVVRGGRPEILRPRFGDRPSEPGDPWSSGARRPGPGMPPDLDRTIRALQDRLRRFGGGLGGGGLSGGPRGGGLWERLFGGPGGPLRGAGLILVGIVALWLATGFYRVEPDEQGVVLQWGAYNRTTGPGLNYHLPWPVESVLLPAVTRINRTEIGYRSDGESQQVQDNSADDATPPARALPTRELSEESLMLTGDENIIDINFTVFWRISDAKSYLFNTRRPDYTVKSAAESVMREVIGRTAIQSALTGGRTGIETAVTTGTQAILDAYGSGIEITQVQLQKVDPPEEVIESFRDVQRANTDADTARNNAQAYANNIVPRARGDAAAVTAAAEGDKAAAIARASGESRRFLSILEAYQQAKSVTLTRLYIETMQTLLTRTPTTIVDNSLRGLLPLLQLGTPSPGAPPAPPGSAAPAAAAAPGAAP